MLESTRWTSTRTAATGRAPFGFGAIQPIPQTPPQLEAQWAELMEAIRPFQPNMTNAALDAIFKAEKNWGDYYFGILGGPAAWSETITSAPDLSPWVAVLNQARGLFQAEMARGIKPQAVVERPSATPRIQVADQDVFGKRAIPIVLFGIATWLVIAGGSNE